MHVKYLFILLLVFSRFSFADDYYVKANELFRTKNGIILAPSSGGWYLESKTDNQLNFSRKASKGGIRAHALFFNSYPTSDGKNLVAKLKKYTKSSLISQNEELLTASYQSYEENNFSYVKFRISSRYLSSDKFIVEQHIGKMCVSRNDGNRAYIVGYTYLSDTVNENFEQEANAFILSAKLATGS